MDATNFLIHQAERQLNAHCSQARAHIACATTIADVVRFSRVQVPTLIKGLPISREVQAVKLAAERKLAVILESQLTTLATAKSKEEGLALLGRMRQQWDQLRGDFSRLYVLADRMAKKHCASWD